MNTTHIPTLKQVEGFVSSNALSLVCQNSAEAYCSIEKVCKQHHYGLRKKPEKGIIRAYLLAVTGYSRTQLARLLKQYVAAGSIRAKPRTQPIFQGIYTAEDIRELARIDDLLDGVSGPATCQVLKREYEVFGNTACQRLSSLSPAQLYRFRRSKEYLKVRVHYTKTKPAKIPIGERTKPRHDGRPGFLRVDSVHQGDKDKVKGVYHINLVDEVTQWEVVVAVEGISEKFMIPALTAALDLFPFVILNFHSDNGSEYINQRVAELLDHMLVKLTKSRPYHSGDNGLAETKNGAIIRKALGWIHIPRTNDNVAAINQWYAAWFVPYLNFHRACAFRETIEDSNGKRHHKYPSKGYMMPYEKLKSLDKPKQYLKPNISFDLLNLQAYAMSDSQWAETMNIQKAAMWDSIQL